MKRLGILIALLILSAIIVAAGWYLVSPLFFDRTVDEQSPFTFPTKDEVGMIMPPAAPQTKAEQVAERLIPPPADAAITARAIVTAMDQEPLAQATAEPTPEAIIVAEHQDFTPKIVYQGNFVDGDTFHKGSGLATIYAAHDGSYLLRLEQFKTTNGPDVHVLLSPKANPTDSTTLGDYLDLGDLKGNIGDQNYALPTDFDPALYKSVVIYCLPFQVIFATATLE